MSHNKFKLNPKIYYVIAFIILSAAAVSASSSTAVVKHEQPLIESHVVKIDASELKEMRTEDSDVVFTLIQNMENGYIGYSDANERIIDIKIDANDYNPANAVETEVNQHFIDFCNSAIDCTNQIYYGKDSAQYKKVYGEMLAKKSLI